MVGSKSSVTGVLLRRRDEDTATEETEGRRPCGDRGRDWSDVATSQGLPRIVSNHQKVGESHGTGSSLQPSRESMAC